MCNNKCSFHSVEKDIPKNTMLNWTSHCSLTLAVVNMSISIHLHMHSMSIQLNLHRIPSCYQVEQLDMFCSHVPIQDTKKRFTFYESRPFTVREHSIINPQTKLSKCSLVSGEKRFFKSKSSETKHHQHTLHTLPTKWCCVDCVI